MAQTKQITIYNQDLLNKCIEKDEAILIGTYEKLTRDIDIKFKCKCGKDGSKMFRYIVENAGMRCSDCSRETKHDKIKITSIQKYGVPSALNLTKNKELCRKSVHVYTLERLENIVGKEHLLQNYDNENLTKDTFIMFRCHNCACDTNKGFRYIFETGGPFCNTCTEQNKQDKIKTKMNDIYGVEYSLQVPEFNDKATLKGLKYKKYVGPSGKIYNCQGYEPYALNLLFIEYTDNDIITSKRDVPEIWWIDADGLQHRYYVDIYIPKEKRMVEVKSDYRYKEDNDKLEFVWRTCVEQGYNYEVWIFDKHHEIVEFKIYSSSSLNGSTSTSSNVSSSSSDK